MLSQEEKAKTEHKSSTFLHEAMIMIEQAYIKGQHMHIKGQVLSIKDSAVDAFKINFNQLQLYAKHSPLDGEKNRHFSLNLPLNLPNSSQSKKKLNQLKRQLMPTFFL